VTAAQLVGEAYSERATRGAARLRRWAAWAEASARAVGESRASGSRKVGGVVVRRWEVMAVRPETQVGGVVGMWRAGR